MSAKRGSEVAETFPRAWLKSPPLTPSLVACTTARAGIWLRWMAAPAWEAKRDYVKAALKAGARVEDGALTVELVKGKGGGFNVEVYDFEKVVVR